MTAFNQSHYFFIILLQTMWQHCSTFSSPCIDPFCPFPPSIAIDPIEQTTSTSLLLGTYEHCICRTSPQLTICFGRDKCMTFPKRIQFTTKEFKLKATSLKRVKRDDLDSVYFANISALYIDGNEHLEEIDSGTFRNLRDLQKLSISSNPELKHFKNGTFEGLVTLKWLILSANGFTRLGTLTPHMGALKSLKVLSLCRNNFATIQNGDFAPFIGGDLRELHIRLAAINYIEPDSFVPLHKLEVLNLGENNVNESTLANVLLKLQNYPLSRLDLRGLGFRTQLPVAVLRSLASTNISELRLASNHFEVLNAHSFPLELAKMRMLDLSDSSILTIENGTFAMCPNLEVLLLAGNQLSAIPETVLLSHLTYLDLQANAASVFYSNYFSLYGQNRFANMQRLKALNLGDNRVNAVYNSSFEGLSGLKALNLRNCTLFFIAKTAFRNLINLQHLDLAVNALARIGIGDIFKGLSNLKVLRLSEGGLSSLTEGAFDDLKNLTHLHLDGNSLHTLGDYGIFKHLYSLQFIDLSRNNLQNYRFGYFVNLTELKSVFLNYNKFNYLSDVMIYDLNHILEVNLGDNPFICDCNFEKMAKSLKSDSKLYRSLEVIPALCEFPEEKSDSNLIDFLKETNCKSSNNSKIIIIIVLAVFIILVCASLIFFRKNVNKCAQFVIISKKLSKISPSTVETNPKIGYIYDAFVSYSHEDQKFVTMLLERLEKRPPFLRLCVYERDFDIGSYIAESVIEAVSRSRKTLLIVSDAYAKSQWCRWETCVAHNRYFFNGVIVIRLGEVSERHLTSTLRFLLESRVYLDWENNNDGECGGDGNNNEEFWRKLRNALEK